jgi:AraC-like DNA-binding protein
MWPFLVRHVGIYTQAQRARYVVPMPTLGVNISGMRWYIRDGARVDVSGPTISLTPGGTVSEFEYGPDRRNYAILVEGDFVRPSQTAGCVDLRQDRDWVKVPASVPIDAERLPGLEAECMQMVEAFRSPTPVNRLRVGVGVCNLLGFLLGRHADPVRPSPAASLKEGMDRDPGHRRSIRELARGLGFSVDHLRVLFLREYGVSPKQYRTRMRLAQAVDLLANSALSLKEIAERTGFRHASHFSTLYRAAFGHTPGEGLRRFRHGQESRTSNR